MDYNLVSERLLLSPSIMTRAQKDSRPPRDVRLRNALQALKEAKAKGIVPVVTHFAREYELSPSTLNGHYTGRRKERRLAHGSQQTLTQPEELSAMLLYTTK